MTPLELARATRRSDIAADVLRGLSDYPKWLSSKLFYDAEGSRLFEEITKLPQYYVTRTEAAILARNAEEIIASAGTDLSIVELGAGSAAKTTLLLRAALEKQGNVDYYPIDVSASALDDASARLRASMPAVRVHPMHMDYDAAFGVLRKISGPKLVLFIGSSIGNFEPFEGSAMLAKVRRNLQQTDSLLLGIDMRKKASVLIPAYDDPRGITAEFNLNILRRINRELETDFDLQTFAHRAVWNSAQSRIEMHLESLITQRVHAAALDRTFSFAKGETIHTENSYKFTAPMIDSMLANAGLRSAQLWSDANRWFSVIRTTVR